MNQLQVFLGFPTMNNTAVALPIATKDRQVAKKFAAQQTSPEKVEQVLLNTLAVLTVKNYLELLGFATSLTDCDVNNPVMRVCSNVADLEIVNYGKIECRPVKNAATSCQIPMDVWEMRLGFVAVKIDDDYQQATIVGFTPKVTAEDFPLSKLSPPEAIIDRLHDLKLAVKPTALVNLKQWFDRAFTESWEAVESLLQPEQLTPAWGFRNAEVTDSEDFKTDRVQRAKLIDLGIQLSDRQVVLLVEVIAETEGTMGVTLQLHPQSEAIYLPQAITLKVIESSGSVFMQSQSREQDNYIQLQFSGQPGETFTVQVSWGDAEFTEQFQL